MNGEPCQSECTRSPLPVRDDPYRPEAGHALVEAYMAKIDAASHRVADPQRVELGLLAAKKAAAERVVEASHRAGTPFPIRSDAGPAPVPRASRMQRWGRRFLLAMAVQSLVFGWFVAFVPAAETSGLDRIVAVGNAAVLFVLAVLLLLRRWSDRRALVPGGGENDWKTGLDVIALGLPRVRFPRRRRAVDIAFASVWLVLLAPVMGALGLLLVRRGPVLRRQYRVGQGGRVFTLLLFSTDRLPSHRLRRIVRASGADQLPRLWNLLKGDLTVLGPKPEYPRLAVQYPAEHHWIFAYRPGLAGPVDGVTRQAAPRNTVELHHYLSTIIPVQARANRLYLKDPAAHRFWALLGRAMYTLVLRRPAPGSRAFTGRENAASHMALIRQAGGSGRGAMGGLRAPEPGESAGSLISCWSRHEVTVN